MSNEKESLRNEGCGAFYALAGVFFLLALVLGMIAYSGRFLGVPVMASLAWAMSGFSATTGIAALALGKWG